MAGAVVSRSLYIDGRWMDAALGGTIPVINPATEALIRTVPAATAEDVDLAVRAARGAFDHGTWPRLAPRGRAEVLRRLATLIRARLEELATLEVQDVGKPLAEARLDIADAADCFDYYAHLIDAPEFERGEAVQVADERFAVRVVREPLGVVGAVTPWNFPFLLAAWKVAPALAAGCTVVLKPSELASLTTLELAALAAEAGVPAGVLNVVSGFGSQAGQALIDHPGIDKLSFTGSGVTGAKVMRAASREMKKVGLELGGKSAFIVFADSDVEKAVEWILVGIFLNQGEVCSATSRVLVQQAIYATVLQRLVEEAGRLRVGDGLQPGVQLGPLISADHHRKVIAAIRNAERDGARIAAGGDRPAGLDTGYFLQPTILTDVSDTSAAWRDEIFGPVLCIRRFADEGEAVRLANDSPFGLAAAVMSANDERCERVAAALHAGVVWINCSQPAFKEGPWGGYKQSGLGRELGRWGLDSYLETKQIARFNGTAPWGWYLK